MIAQIIRTIRQRAIKGNRYLTNMKDTIAKIGAPKRKAIRAITSHLRIGL